MDNLLKIDKLLNDLNTNSMDPMDPIKIESLLYFQLNNIKSIIKIIYSIELTEDNHPTVISLIRNIMDNYSLLFFIFKHCEEKERDFRHKLYLIDGYRTYLNIYSNFESENLEFTLHPNRNKDQLINECISLNSTNLFCKKKDINDGNWKFKKNSSPYSWKNLYEISLNGNKQLSTYYSNYFSNFTHGLSLFILQKPNLSLHKFEQEILFIIIIDDIKNIVNDFLK